MMDKIERTLASNITKDLCAKVRTDIRAVVERTAGLSGEPIQAAFIYAEAAREMLIGASAHMSYEFKDSMSPKKAFEIIRAYVNGMNDQDIVELEKTYGVDKPVGDKIRKNQGGTSGLLRAILGDAS